MPLTAKGTEILSAMQKEYGEKEGERVFYASRNAGVVSGVDSEYELTGKSVFNLDNMAEQISSLGSEAKRLAERMDAWNGRAGGGNWKVHPSKPSQDRSMGEKMNADGWSLQKVKDWCAKEGYGSQRTAAFVAGWNVQEARG